MSQGLDDKAVRHVALLARIELTDEQVATFGRQMADIVAYMDKLQELDTDGVEPMMHALEMSNVLRDDAVGASMPRELALKTAPQHDGEYFIVPQILDGGDA